MACNKKLGFETKNNNSELNDYFGVSFINRIDEIITLKPLDESAIIKIIHQEYRALNNDKALNNKDLKEIIDKSNYHEYGARQVKKLLQQNSNFKKIKKNSKNYSKN